MQLAPAPRRRAASAWRAGVVVARWPSAAVRSAGARHRAPATDPPSPPSGTQLQHVVDLVAALQTDRAAQHGELLTRLSEADRAEPGAGRDHPQPAHEPGQPQGPGPVGRAHGRRRAAPGRPGRGGQLPPPDLGGRRWHPRRHVPPAGRPRAPHGREVPDRQLPARPRGADADHARAAAKAFLRDVRQRIREVTTRAYIDPDTTVDYVLLFIPNESVYSFMHEHDPGLVDAALGAAGGAVLAVHPVRHAGRHPPGDGLLPPRAGRRRDPAVPGRVHARSGRSSPSRSTSSARRLESTQRAYDDLAGTRRKALQRTIDQVDELRTRRGLDGPEAPPGAPARLFSPKAS